MKVGRVDFRYTSGCVGLRIAVNTLKLHKNLQLARNLLCASPLPNSISMSPFFASHFSLISAVAALAISGAVIAAPAIDDSANPSSGTAAGFQQGATGALDRNGESTVPSSGSSSVDRILQLQESGHTSGSSDRPTPRKVLTEGTLPPLSSGPAAHPASAANPLAALQSVILGNQGNATQASTSDASRESMPGRARDHEPQRSNSGSMSSETRRPSGGGLGSESSSGFAVTAARYVRENRVLVIGISLAILALVWGAASFASQRRR